MPPGNCISVDDDQTARPRGPRASECDPESPIDVVERWPRPLFLERRHLLSQSEVLHHDIGSAPTHCSKRANAERDQDDKNTEHGGEACSSFPAISSLQRIPKPGGLRPVSP